MNKIKHFTPFFAFIFIFGVLLLSTNVTALSGYASPNKIILSGDLGKTFQRHLLIKNINDVPVNVIMSTDYSNIKLLQTNFRLDPNANKTADFDVTIDQEGEVNETIDINFITDSGSSATVLTVLDLTGTSANDSQDNSSDNNSTQNNQTNTGNQDVLITADLNSQTPVITEGSDMIIDVELTNTGESNTEYNVTAYDYQNWADLLIINPQKIDLNSGETGNVQMHFNIKNNITGYHEYMVRVNYGESHKEEPVSLIINAKYPENMTDIAYVVKNTGIPDSAFISVINSLGYSYKLIGSTNVSTTDFSKYKMILLGDDKVSGVPVNNYKSMIAIANPDTYKYYKNFSYGKGSSTNENVYNNNQNISITHGLNQSFAAYTRTGINVYYLTGVKYNSKSVSTKGTSANDMGHFAIAIKDSPRRVFFGITESDYWSDESRQLFANSLQWIIKGEDADHDSYMGDYDCNDSNSLVWRNVLAYVDKDKDSYGSGQMVNVCIGNTLPAGYSFINGDCNDNDSNIHPGSLEIPYNGIDEKCIGYDLADLDSDGYCKLGYSIQNATLQCNKETGTIGTDCNDNNASINPGSNDVYKNCKNDAPILDNINSITVNEGEDVVINVHAVDPENDNLTISINDSRFTQNNNVFTWQTGYEDYGTYMFKVSASDGKLTSTKEVEVSVTDKNRAPVCSDISNIVWNENGNATVDLKKYCSDPDGDPISYEFYDVSDDNIIPGEITNGVASITSSKYWYGEGWAEFILSDGNDETITKQINITVNHVNQVPELTGNISNINLHESTNSTNKINLNDYFSDLDSNLSYSVSGNDKIGIDIIDGFVNFYPTDDFVGNESVIFSANDGEFNVSSNEVLLNVIYVNKPPKFGEMNCSTDILENNLNNCELLASDIENDSFSYSVLNEDKLNCEITGNNLSYIGQLNYYGNATCTIRVSDETGYSDFVLNTQIEHINQAPKIYSYSPISQNIKVLENNNKQFIVNSGDVDGDNTTINWLIGNEVVGTNNIFNFNKPRGLYNLTVVVSDLEFNSSNSWNINVGAINDFKCSEVGGHICSSDQICNGNILNVYDSSNCCSVSCSGKPLEFKNIKREANLTDSTSLTLVKPGSGDEFYTGDKIPIELNIVNDVVNSVDFDVYVYLYDYTTQSVVERTSDSFKLGKETTKTSSYELEIPEKINEDDEFYIFAKLEGKDNKNKYYDEKYNEIKISRKSNDIEINNVDIAPKDLLCGDSIHMSVKLNNYGKNSEDTYIDIQSPELKIDKQTPDFTLDSYDDSNNGDSIVKEIDMKIDDNAAAGNYTIKTGVYYAGEYNYINTDIILGECKAFNTQTEPVVNAPEADIKLESKSKVSKSMLPQNEIIILISTVSMLIIFVIFMIAGKFYRRNQIIIANNKLIKNKMKKKRK